MPISKTFRIKTNDMAPISIVRVNVINKNPSRSLVYLIDICSTWTIIQSTALPPGVAPIISLEIRIITTAN